MKKRIIRYAVMFLCVALVAGTFAWLYKKSRPEEVRYNEIEVVGGNIQRSTIVTGTIQPRNEVNIKPQINGIIAELFKEAGQSVKENEVIARLKVIPDMGSLSSAQSRVRLAEINLKQAQTNYDREKTLFDKDLVSSEEFDQVAQALDQAREESAAAKDALDVVRDGVSSANATSSSTLVRSTVNGLILDVPVKVGNSVIQANTMNDGTTVATVANMNDLIFDGKIDETEVGTLKEGIPMTITIGALQNYSFQARLEYISPKAVENNGANQFEIKAAVAVNSDVNIRSGFSANAEIVLQSVENVLVIPESALEFDGDITSVYIKIDENQYEKREVQTGLSDGINIEIKNGLVAGDVVRGTKILKDVK